MIARTSIRWHVVAWVTSVLVAAFAVIFVVVYERTGEQLQAQIDHDVAGDVSQLSQTVRALPGGSPHALLAEMSSYLRAQPYTGASSLLFASIHGYGTVSNHPELIGTSTPDDGETQGEQAQENAVGRALVAGLTGLTTRPVADVGRVRFDQRVVMAHGYAVRLGSGEPLIVVVRAERSIAKAFIIAGALALLLALVASYIAASSISLPMRRMARVATRVDEGDLKPRMGPSTLAGSEMRVLADSFNHMLDRLDAAFSAQRDFIADASHELRTPLTVIGGQLEVLAAQDHPDAAEVRRVERMVTAEIARMSRLVDDMLLLARSERRDFLRYEEIPLPRFVNELWMGAGVSDQRRFELGPVPDGVLHADPDRLAQALRNLIRNAVEHTADQTGLVRLETQARAGGRVRFAVIDDGPGIPSDQLERVFERFHRTDSDRSREAGGAGLGLAIALAVAEAHGGTARAVQSSTGGARLELELPGLTPAASPRGAATADPGKRARTAASGARARGASERQSAERG